MRSTLGALARWSAILGLCLVVAVTIPLTWITHKMTGGGLWIAERAKRELNRLLREVR